MFIFRVINKTKKSKANGEHFDNRFDGQAIFLMYVNFLQSTKNT